MACCPSCFDTRYDSPFKVGGHTSRCKEKLRAADEIEYFSEEYTVTEPVAVIPSTMVEKDYYIDTQSRQARNSLTLLVIPVGFIFRDDWEYLSPSTELSSFYTRLNRNFDLSNYASASQDKKRIMYADALGVLWAAGKKESGQVEGLVEEADEESEQDDFVVEEQEVEY
jgi:hypothetical protein